jgi:hypothetical protein
MMEKNLIGFFPEEELLFVLSLPTSNRAISWSLNFVSA